MQMNDKTNEPNEMNWMSPIKSRQIFKETTEDECKAKKLQRKLKAIEIPMTRKTWKLWCFLFYQKICTLFQKYAISCLFLKNVSPYKRAICFIRNNKHFPMVEGIAFYTLHKLRVLIIPCKADGFCLFIKLPDEIYKKASGSVIKFRI